MTEDPATNSVGVPGGTAAPLDVTVVASWYPSIEDPVRGRFVADQVAALQGHGAVRVRVASFDRIPVSGAGAARRRQVDVAREAAQDAIRHHRGLWHERGWALDDPVPVARLPIVEPGPEHGGPLHAVEARRLAVEALADRPGEPAPDLVHAHTSDPDGFAAIALADRFDLPLVVTEHATFLERLLDDPARLELARAVARRAARLVAVGDELAALLRQRLPEYADRVVVIPNAVAVEAFTPRGAAERRPNELLSVGYLTETKGVDVLLRAFALVRRVRPDLRLRLIGRAPTADEEGRWVRFAADLGVRGGVIFEGPALRAGVAHAMERATLLVHASRKETFGIVAVEALAAGLPVVATATPPVAATFGDRPGELGELVAIDDPGALAAGIERALARRESFDPLAMRRSVESRFGSAVVADRIVELYREVLAERPRHTRLPPGSGGTHGPAEPVADADASDPSGRAGERAESPPAPAAGPILVIALDEARASRLLGPLPEAFLAGITCLTGPDTRRPLPPALGAIVRGSGDEEYQLPVSPRFALGNRRGTAWRVLRVALDPTLPLRRLRARRARDAMRTAAAREAARQAIGGLAPGSRIVCLTGLDHALVADFGLPPGVEIVPGGARWLADEAVATAAPSREPIGTGDRALRIAMYAPADLNVIDGSAIWVESTLRVLSLVPGAEITVPLRAPVIRDVLTAPLRKIPGVRLIRWEGPMADVRGRLSPEEAVTSLEVADADRPFESLLIRGYDVCRIAAERGSFDGRLLATYVLEPERDIRSSAYLDGLAMIVRASRWTVVQSPEMADLFESLVPAARGRLAVLPPGLAPEARAARPAPIRNRLIYAGKFTPYYALEEIVAAFSRLRRRWRDLEFHVAGDKIMHAPGDPGYRERMRRLLTRTDGLVWHGAMGRSDVSRLLGEGGIALTVWNRPDGADMNDLVVSTKLLDYCAGGVPVLATRTQVQAKLLGVDYPLFVDGPSDVHDALQRALASPELQQAAAERALQATLPFTYPAIATSFARYVAGDRRPE